MIYNTTEQPNRLMRAGAECATAPSEQVTASRRVSRGFFVGTMVGSYLAVPLLTFVGFALTLKHDEKGSEIANYMLVLALIALFYPTGAFLVLLDKAWASIQDESTRTTPRKAVGFLFIPVFNVRWMFVAVGGFADEYNAYITRARISAPRLNTMPFRCLSFCSLLCHIPLLRWIMSLATAIAQCVVANRLCSAINGLSGCAGKRDAAGF
jgi:hypothetical protein